MKKSLILTGAAFMVLCNAFSQSVEEKPKAITETMYIMPKQGMEDKFEAAVKAHDTKFHPDGPYQAGLRKVEYGEKSGWYVWVFGPTSYASLDSRPAKEGGHAADWSATVDPLVDTYGQTQLWELNQELSYGLDKLKTAKYYEAWSIKLKRGEGYRFKAMAEKLEKTYESMGKNAFLVFENPIHTAHGADVSFLLSFNSYSDWSKDAGTKQAFEKIYGANSWQHMLDEWRDIYVEYDSEVRSFVR